MNNKSVWFCLAIAVVVGLFVTTVHNQVQAPGFPPVMVSQQSTAPLFTPVQRDIRIIPDVGYCNSGNPKNKLDLYLPPGQGYPVVVFVHGGSWKDGDRSLYGHLGRYFSSNGIGAVIPSVRLVPEVTCEGELEDVVAAYQWTQKNILSYGGDPSNIILMGHSSGAHLTALTATKGQVRPAGVVCISGLYTIGWNVRLGGCDAAFKGLDKRAYSPANYVKAGLPPFLVMYAENDYRTLAGQAIDFHRRLQRVGVSSELFMVPKEDHTTAIINIVLPSSKHGTKILEWIRSH